MRRAPKPKQRGAGKKKTAAEMVSVLYYFDDVFLVALSPLCGDTPRCERLGLCPSSS